MNSFRDSSFQLFLVSSLIHNYKIILVKIDFTLSMKINQCRNEWNIKPENTSMDRFWVVKVLLASHSFENVLWKLLPPLTRLPFIFETPDRHVE